MGQLEPQLRAVLRGRIKHFIKERGLTAILVTHDQTEANALADRIAVMEGGVLQQFDTPDMLKQRPANLFTGTFVGEPPMNVFEAYVGTAADKINLRLPDGLSLDYDKDAFSGSVRDELLKRRAGRHRYQALCGSPLEGRRAGHGFGQPMARRPDPYRGGFRRRLAGPGRT